MELNTLKTGAGREACTPSASPGESGRARARRVAAGTRAKGGTSGGFHKVGFEGGQMPLQRRLPSGASTPLDPRRPGGGAIVGSERITD